MQNNYVGKEDDERIMKVIEEMESFDKDDSVYVDISDLFFLDMGNKFYLED